MKNDRIILIGFESAALVKEMVFFITEAEDRNVQVVAPDDFMAGLSDPDLPHMVAVSKDMQLRCAILYHLTQNNYRRHTFIHSSVILGLDAKVGQGSFLFPMVMLASAAIVDDDCIVSPYAMVSHYSILGRGSIMQPYSLLAGSTTTGQCCKLNIRSSVVDHVTIADNVEIGAGSLVTKPITEPGFYLGYPARKKIS